MSLPAYAELHCLSNYTFPRGASHPEELVARAVEAGYAALAITDECSLAGVVRAHLAAKAPETAGLQLIIGAEFVIEDGPKIVLLAKNRAGYGNLSALITLARRRVGKGRYRLTRGDLAAPAPIGAAGGLTDETASDKGADHASSTSVPGGTFGQGAVPDCLLLWCPGPRLDAAAVADGRWLAERFPGRVWIAVELHAGPDDAARLAELRALGAACGLPLVATGDAHMHVRRRRALQDVLTALRLKTTVAEAGHALHPNGERHLRSRLRLARLYPDDLLAETVQIARQCTFSLAELRYEYPDEVVPHGQTPASYLRAEVERGLARRYPSGVPDKVAAQVEHELALIGELAYEAYFLTVYDIVRFARAQGILCQGRGSAANSAVCYALGITEVDPARSKLLFERFISKERGEPPDIDVDFEHERREEVIQYLYAKYGRDRAALTASVITYRKKGALRDVGRALGFDRAVLDALSGSLAWWDSPEQIPDRLQALGLTPESPRVARWLALANELRGFPRHLSQHVGGFVIARGPLGRLVPVENAAMPERSVIQWDKDDIDALGLLKVDVLALGMLTAIRRALDLITQQRGRPFALADIPPENPAVYDMLCAADSMGVFQVESRAQMSMLPRLKPRNFYDLVIEVAIVRPGPIQGDMVHPYLRRRHGKEAIEPMTPEVAAVLGRTYGVPIFQEQVMALAVAAAGFTPGEADRLRRAMAAWRRRGGLEPFEAKLIEGMRANGYPEAFARRVYAQIRGFGEYGFPESHAASFALLVYVSAWIKRHHPAAFLVALLNSQPMGFYQPSQLIQDARKHGVQVLPVDVIVSDWDNTLDTAGAVRLGLREVRGLSAGGAGRLLAVRQTRTFAGLADLMARAGLERRDLDALAAADAFATLAGHRRQAAWAAAASQPAARSSGSRDRSAMVASDLAAGSLQVTERRAATGHPPVTRDLFADVAEREAELPQLAPLRAGEEVVADYASLGYSLRDHPLQLLRRRLAAHRFLPAAALEGVGDRSLARVAGLVTCRQRPGTASGVIFVTLEDETGWTNVIVHPHLVERQRRELLGARLLGVYGQVQREGTVVHLVAKRLVDCSQWIGELAASSRDFC